jgi:CubicO group peptidase (beta-lactamase class C family)
VCIFIRRQEFIYKLPLPAILDRPICLYKTMTQFSTSLLCLLWLTGCSQTHYRDTNYVYSKPVQNIDGIATDDLLSVQIDTTKIVQLTKLILSDSFPDIHSLLIAKDNKLVYENYFEGKDESWGSNLGYASHDVNKLHDIRSISKSVVAACIDIAVQQNKIKNIDEPIFNYLTDYKEFENGQNKNITIRHLLTMSSGLNWDEDVPHGTRANDETQMERSSNPVEYVLNKPILYAPGTVWKYNSGGVQVLAEIIKEATGYRIDDFADRFLFASLGIKEYKWIKSHRDFPAAASGLRLTSRDLLKLGLLYLNNGTWNNQQLISERFVSETLKTQILREPGPTTKGYSFLFWTQTDTISSKQFPLIIARGNGGQRIFINKDSNLIVVITAGNYNKAALINIPELVFDKYILTALNSKNSRQH